MKISTLNSLLTKVHGIDQRTKNIKCLMDKVIEKVSYIIGYRQSNQERLDALLFVLDLLRKYFPTLEIIVVELDDKPKLQLDSSLKIKQFFIELGGLYNLSKANNFGASQTDKEILVFSCSDVFLSKEDFLSFFQAGEDFEAATPHKKEMFNVSITDKVEHQFNILDKRPISTFAGGTVLITRSGFEKIGGWDERFEGWGAEDDVFSHLIYNKLVSKTFYMPYYHIDHSRTVFDGNKQPSYKKNIQLLDEILTKNGHTLNRYIDFLQNNNKHRIPKTPKFVLAIRTFNEYHFLKKMMDTFFKTRNSKANWTIIIAADNFSEETRKYLSFLKKEEGAIIINDSHKKAKGRGHVNAILKKLSTMDFDLCFKCDDDIVFKAKGWDDLYWDTIQRSNYDHLVFYDKSWEPQFNLKKPIQKGDLVANCRPEWLQGSFFTITKRVLDDVGYFDEQLFGQGKLTHIDYTFRCARAGYNVLIHPFDVVNSNSFLQIQTENPSVSTSRKTKNSSDSFWYKNQIIQSNRIYIYYNENFKTIDIKASDSAHNKVTEKQSEHKEADTTFYSGRGVVGVIGHLIRLFYNFGIKRGINFIPTKIKGIGVVLTKIGTDLIYIDE